MLKLLSFIHHYAKEVHMLSRMMIRLIMILSIAVWCSLLMGCLNLGSR